MQLPLKKTNNDVIDTKQDIQKNFFSLSISAFHIKRNIIIAFRRLSKKNRLVMKLRI